MTLRIMMSLITPVLLAGSLTAQAGLINFDFQFRDSDGSVVGTGLYTFDDITPGVKASFSSLTNFSWAFEITGFGISLSSALGDVPSTDSLTDEGILLTGAVGSRTLTFFDDALTNIFHSDVSGVFPTGVQFKDTIPTQAEYALAGVVNTGTFTATERTADVPEPTIFALMGIGLAGIGYRRRHRNK